jgi:DNA ligase (NAD+)
MLVGLMNKEERIIDLLEMYDDLYYNEGTSPVSDIEYDELREKAKILYPDNGYFIHVGSPTEKGKVLLPYVLGSLNKVNSETVDKWLDKQPGEEFLITEKLDGVDFIVTYFKGKVVFAATRGDGYYGQDITDKAKIFCPEIEFSDKIVLRGQAMLIGDVHKGLGFKTARNGTAGIINREDTKDCKHITPYFFEIIEGYTGNELGKYYALEDWFDGMVPNYYVKIIHPTVSMVIDIENILKGCKKYSNYEIDGLVITPIDYVRENVLRPENKVAFKKNEEAVEATVSGIEWNVSRTGRVVPVVLIEPIEMQGVTVSRATGFNAKFVYDNYICKGVKIGLQRSGDVIPYITEVYESKPYMLDSACDWCPSCEQYLTWKGVDLVCTNPNCGDQAYNKVEHFLRRMGAENITVKTLMKLGLDTVEKCYEIDEWEIATMDGFGVKRAQVVVDEIQGTLYTTPDKLISALGIPGIGRTISKTLCNIYEDCIDFLFKADKGDFLMLDGIGEVLATNIIEHREKYKDLVNFLYGKGLRFEKSEGEKMLDGKIFTLTGKGSMGRKEIQNLITKAGGMVKGISKKTDYLVTGDIESKSGKAKKARKYGIEIISYEILLEMLN